MAFSYTRTITVDSTQCGSSGAQANYPVLVSISDTSFKTVGNGGRIQNASGYDIAFYSDSGLTTALFWEIESYNASTGVFIAWVNLGTGASELTSASNAVFYVGYGDSGISTFQSTATSVWDSHYGAVYHLNGTANDSTINANTSTLVGSPSSTTGQINGAYTLDGLTQYITVNHASSISPSAITLSAWINGSSFLGDGGYCSVITANNTDYHAFLIKGTGKLACYVTNSSGTNIAYDGTGSHTLLLTTSYYVSMVYDSVNGLIGYVNGASDGTAAASGTLSDPISQTWIGNDPAASTRRLGGTIDEPRISSIARSADWNLIDYNSQNAPGNIGSAGFLTYGTETSTASGGGIDANCELMLHLNNDVVDASQNNFSITNTNVTFSNSSPKFTSTYYGVFNGSSAWLSVPSNAVWDFGSGSFTIEMWINFTALPTAGHLMYLSARNDPGTNNGWELKIINSSGTYTLSSLLINSAGFGQIDGTISPVINTWYHVAYVRNGTAINNYWNGTSVGSATSSTAIGSTSAVVSVGNLWDGASGSLWFNGEICEHRISNIARWVSNFTPPTSPYTSATSLFFRKTLSSYGSGVGKRQLQGWAQ